MSDLKIELVKGLPVLVAEMAAVKAEAYYTAEQIASAARATAPVGPTGHYAAGIQAQTTLLGARVVALAPESAWVEFGVPFYNIPATWHLRRTAVALGYTMK